MYFKEATAYVACYLFLKQKFPFLNVKENMSDFETAIGNAAAKVYEGIKIIKCYFHYTQVTF